MTLLYPSRPMFRARADRHVYLKIGQDFLRVPVARARDAASLCRGGMVRRAMICRGDIPRPVGGIQEFVIVGQNRRADIGVRRTLIVPMGKRYCDDRSLDPD